MFAGKSVHQPGLATLLLPPAKRLVKRAQFPYKARYFSVSSVDTGVLAERRAVIGQRAAPSSLLDLPGPISELRGVCLLASTEKMRSGPGRRH